MTLLAFPTLATATTITGLATRLEATDGSTRAIGGWPLQDTSAIDPAAFTSGGKYAFSVTVDKGAGAVEVQCFAKGLGRYDNGKYRTLYLEIAVDGTLPVYPAITAGNAAARKSNVPATNTTNGWVVTLRLTVASTLAPLTRAVNNTGTPASMWEDMTAGVDGACPLAWRQDVTKMGRTNAVCLPTDPNYLTKCGAFPYLLTRAEEESAASYTGSTASTVAGWAASHNDHFDRYIRDMWWNDVRSEVTGSFGPQSKFTNRVITNATFRWSDGDTAGVLVDLTNTSREGYGDPEPIWDGTAPPQHGLWRFVTGGTSNATVNGLQPNYYDRAQLFRKKWCQTGDLEYFRRFAAHAFAYRHWSRFDNEGSSGGHGHIYGPAGQQVYMYQPQGIGEYYGLTGDPYALVHIEAQAESTRVWSDFGDSGSGLSSGSPRPMARTVHVHRHARNWTRPANASYPEGNTAGVNGVEAQDWGATLAAKMTKVLTGTAHVTSAGVTFNGTYYAGLPAPGPQGQYWSDISDSPGTYWREFDTHGPLLPITQRLTCTLEQVGQNPFMMAILPEAEISVAHNNPAIGSTVQTSIVDDVDLVARFQYATLWDGTPADNPNVPLAARPSFRVAFNSYPHVDQYAWYQAADDLTMLYPHMFAWVAWQKASGEMRALTERIIGNGILSVSTSGSKQGQEAHCFIAECFAALSQSPAASAITTYDVPSEVVLSATSGTLPLGSTTSITATIRDVRRVKLVRTPTISASHPSIATGALTSTSTDVTGATYTVTITPVSVGESTIWITDPATQLTSSYLVRVTTPQFTEPFDTDITSRPAVWTTSLSGPGSFANAPSGELRVGTTVASFSSGTALAKLTNLLSLDVAGANGVTFQWTSATGRLNTYAEIWLVDASNNGIGIQLNAGGGGFSCNTVTVAAGVASGGVAYLSAATQDVPMWFRFRKSGTNYAIDYSALGVAYTPLVTGTLASANSPTTAAMRLVFLAHGGFNLANEARFDSITWADGSAPVGPADPYVPSGTASALAIAAQPSSSGVSGVALPAQPVVWVEDGLGALATSDTSTVTASLVVTAGSMTAIGTLARAAVGGVVSWSGLGGTNTGLVDAVAYWHFTDGALTAVDSASFTIPAVVAPLPFRGRRFFF